MRAISLLNLYNKETIILSMKLIVQSIDEYPMNRVDIPHIYIYIYNVI